MTPLLAGALAGTTLLFWAAAAGPVPDVAPAAGQNPAPGPRERCQVGPVSGPLQGVDPRGLSGLDPNPLVGQRWFVDPREPAWQSYVSYAHQGQTQNAGLMWRLAREPRFRWFGRWSGPDVSAKVRAYWAARARSSPAPCR